MTTELLLTALSDNELVAHVATVAREERCATARLIAALVEFDRRKLYREQGCSSLFTYCTDVLHLSEAATCNRSAAARAAAKFPAVLGKLQDGSLSLTAVRLLAPVLTAGNADDVLARATHQSTREVERLVATLRPKPDVTALIRKLPDRAHDVVVGAPCGSVSCIESRQSQIEVPASVQSFEAPPVVASHVRIRPLPAAAKIAPLSAERFKIQFTASRPLHDKLRRAQDLMRHSIPNGDPAAIVERALDLLLAQLEKRKFGATSSPRSSAATAMTGSRHIPAEVRREVSRRDGDQCAFVGAAGRCRERGFLEFHHVHAYADGGPATVENIELRCRAHNQYEAELLFGLDLDPEADTTNQGR